nr:hypothetical protein [Segatella salivae]
MCVISCDKIRQITQYPVLPYFSVNYQQSHPHNWFTTQLGTSCSFDSPGLARNEPTPGKHSQGDSTP